MPKTKRTKRKAAIATVVSPVAEFRKQFNNGKKQATLTQMYHDSDATESEEESSEDESFEKVKKSEIVSPPPVVTPTVKRFKSFKSSVNNSSQAVEVGDLVMCTAREVDHPLYEEGIIDKAFILFGIVKAFSVVKWNTFRVGQVWEYHFLQTLCKDLFGRLLLYISPNPYIIAIWHLYYIIRMSTHIAHYQ